MVKKLITKEFEVTEETLKKENQYKLGEKYSVFVDPETGKYYRPINGFDITATEDSDLLEWFVEVK